MLIKNLMDEVRVETENPGISVIMTKQVTPEQIKGRCS